MKLAIFAAALLTAGAVQAATTGVTVSITGANPGQASGNVPTISVMNSGDLGELIGLSVTIGDLDYNFDGVEDEVATGLTSFSLDVGDRNLSSPNNATGRFDTIVYSFTGFDAGDSFDFAVDVDEDNRNSSENFAIRMLPGGSMTFLFAGGVADKLVLDLTPSQGDSDPYSYRALASGDPSPAPVPLPAGLPLMLTALGGAAFVARRKRNG